MDSDRYRGRQVAQRPEFQLSTTRLSLSGGVKSFVGRALDAHLCRSEKAKEAASYVQMMEYLGLFGKKGGGGVPERQVGKGW